MLCVARPLDSSTKKDSDDGRLPKPPHQFRVRMKADAFGWNGCPVYLMVKDGETSKFKWNKVDLSRLPAGTEVDIPEPSVEFKPPPDDNKVIFGLFEIWRGRWKGGLDILQVIIQEVG
ncbi:hypothetical protein B296_00044868 [Ensete ventricosum]|uniref:Uncharacterized protein n=1 Tax=Ensete ventricosum TaxID=4639 RepID=A0A426XGU0_ENSVE|nr:hypothetical protein B296_00044868 [Ensete ventricosum]